MFYTGSQLTANACLLSQDISNVVMILLMTTLKLKQVVIKGFTVKLSLSVHAHLPHRRAVLQNFLLTYDTK